MPSPSPCRAPSTERSPGSAVIFGLDLLLRTDSRGRLLAIEEASPALRGPLRAGGTLAPLVAEGSAPALLDFLFGLRRTGAALAWDLTLSPTAARPEVEGGTVLHLLGVETGEGSVVCGSSDRERLLRIAKRIASPEGETNAGAGALFDRRELDPAARAYLAGLCQAYEWEEALLAPGLARENAALRRQLAEQAETIAELRAEAAGRERGG